VFGSQAKGYARPVSDWDVAVYFNPQDPRELELESAREYPEAHSIWGDLETLLHSEVDLLVLNRAKPSLVFSVLNTGTKLVIKHRTLYLRLLMKTYYEAVDYWRFVETFGRIRERSRSLSPEDRSNLIEHVIFLENEMKDLAQFQEVTQKEYMNDRNTKRNIERWVENLLLIPIFSYATYIHS
jgi:predicted nucleotidyltransferase